MVVHCVSAIATSQVAKAVNKGEWWAIKFLANAPVRRETDAQQTDSEGRREIAAVADGFRKTPPTEGTAWTGRPTAESASSTL